MNNNLILKNILIIIFLPLFLLKDLFHSPRGVGKKILWVIVILLAFGLNWWSIYQEIYSTITYSLFETGVSDKLTKVQVSGTSMLPTIQDGSEVELKNPQKYGLERGDIISFQNQETGGLFYIKRIIGLPGESVSIKNGHVSLNGKILDEDYTYNHLPTFGNSFLLDCDSQIVPEGSFFVMGDNRTVSFDSRAIGFVEAVDIDGVIKTNYQEKFLSTETAQKILKVSVDPKVFLTKLNQKRTLSNLPGLVTHSELNNLSQTRALQVSSNLENFKSDTIPLDKALQDLGYRFNLAYEYVTYGYLNEEDLINQIFESSSSKDQFLSSQYTEVGIGVSEKQNKECTFPLISVILSWPSIPTYNTDDIESWNKEIQSTNKILSDLQTYVGNNNYDAEKLRTLISSVATQNQTASRLYNKMKNREWLTDKDYSDIKEYDTLVGESNRLINELFPQ